MIVVEIFTFCTTNFLQSFITIKFLQFRLLLGFSHFCTSALCNVLAILSHFNKIGYSGEFYGNEIYKGVRMARNEMRGDLCFTLKKHP